MGFGWHTCFFHIFLLSFLSCCKIQALPTTRYKPLCSYKTYLSLQKIDLSFDSYSDEGSCVGDTDGRKRWHLHLLEQKDIKAAADLAFLAFYKPRFKYDVKDWSALENLLFGPIIFFLDSVDRLDAWLANYIGLWSRAGKRLKVPTLEKTYDSIFLAATHADSTNTTLLAVVELSLDEANGLLSPPLRPFFPLSVSTNRKPYLSNLCVHPGYRRQGLGRFMCCAVETIALRFWAENSVYLHVEKGNRGAEYLYRSLGYAEVDILSEKQKRQHNMMQIHYFCKEMAT